MVNCKKCIYNLKKKYHFKNKKNYKFNAIMKPCKIKIKKIKIKKIITINNNICLHENEIRRRSCLSILSGTLFIFFLCILNST
jgi:hypothetical protein